MNVKYLIITLFFVSSILIAQKVSIRIEGAINEAILLKIEGEKTRRIKEIIPENSNFQFLLDNQPYGIYRLEFDNRHRINFINDGEDLELKTDFNNLVDSLKIVKSESNLLYYDFLKLNKLYKTKTELLNLILVRYPQDDAYYSVTQNRLTEIQNEYLDFVQNISRRNANSFIARYIFSSQLPVIPQKVESDKQLDYLKANALNNVDFDDVELINSDVYTKKTIEYLTYYRNPQLPKELLENEFMKAVDILLNKAKINQLVYQHITEYLIDGFKKFGFDKIIDYIVENYVIKDDLCLDEKTETSIQKRIDQSKMLSLGTEAPNILMPDINGNIFDLSKLQSKNTLLVFYSSECPHCQSLMPRLNKLQKERNDIKIVAVSLNTKQKDWIKFIEDNQLNLLNINDPNGWSGTIASDYYIYATPTMFYLNKEKKIVGKPTSYAELADLL